jgi:hypothetical protein
MIRTGTALCLLLVSASAQEETGDNSEYTAWAKEKPGAWVKWAVETHTGAMKISADVTWTLRDLAPDKAVIDEKTVLKVAGQSREHAATRVHFAKIPKGTNSDGVKVKAVKEGDEEIAIQGRMVKCRWVEMEFAGQRGGSVKIWKTDEIVGGAARRETRHDEAGKLTLTMTAVDWKKAD